LHDDDRSFPLWHDTTSVTNLSPLEQPVYADTKLLVGSDMSISKERFAPYSKEFDKWDDNRVIDTIDSILLSTFENFLTNNDKPIRLYITGGIDTITLWAYLDKFTKNYEICDYNYVKHTLFYKNNKHALKKFWAYNQIHLWDEDCVLVTGGNGDENLLRGPYTLALMLKHYGLTLEDILQPDDYHYLYHLKKEIVIEDDCLESTNVKNSILNINVNDHQHWHLDKTLFFTPYKNIKLCEVMLHCSKDLLVLQGRSGFVNRELIARHDSSKLKYITKYKNL